jgi:5-formyltetrahydrofolate cyclo-ligase
MQTKLYKNSKTNLRIALKTLINSSSPQDRSLKDKSIISHLHNTLASLKFSSLGIYSALAEEINIAEPIFALGKTVAFPSQDLAKPCFRIADFDPKSIYSNDDGRIIVPEIVIIPIIGYNRQKYRLGRGSGFFDRYLYEHPTIYKIGLAYSFQERDFAADGHDIKLDIIITEKGILK